MPSNKHRDPLDTLPPEPVALSELRAASARPTDDEPAPHSGSVARERDPLPDPRATMPTVPFDLTETAPAALAPPRTRMPSEPFRLVRVSSRPPPAPTPTPRLHLSWGLALVVLVLVAAGTVWLASSGLLEARPVVPARAE